MIKRLIFFSFVCLFVLSQPASYAKPPPAAGIATAHPLATEAGFEIQVEVGAGVAVGNGVAVGIAVSVGTTLTTSAGSGVVSDWQPLTNANIQMVSKRRPIRLFPPAFFNFVFIVSVLDRDSLSVWT